MEITGPDPETLPDLWTEENLEEFELEISLALGTESVWCTFSGHNTVAVTETEEMMQIYVHQLLGEEIEDYDNIPETDVSECNGNDLIKRYSNLADFKGYSDNFIENEIFKLVCQQCIELKMG